MREIPTTIKLSEAQSGRIDAIPDYEYYKLYLAEKYPNVKRNFCIMKCTNRYR